MAEILDKHCDIILVGDSLGSVLYGMKSTREVSLNMMINHTKSVKQGIKKSLLVVDMPYKTYQNKNQALKNVKKVIQSTKCDAVKLEGGKKIIKIKCSKFEIIDRGWHVHNGFNWIPLDKSYINWYKWHKI